MVENYKPLMVLVTETHVTSSMDVGQFSITGYNLINCCSDSRHTGGVLIYARTTLKYRILINSQKNKNWFLAIDVLDGMKPGHYGVLYHSPSASDALFLKLLEEEWLDDFIDSSKNNVLAGDFNIDWLSQTDAAGLKLVMDTVNLKQQVQQPTRITRTSKTLIDHIFTDCDINVCVENDLKISDHETLCMSIENANDDAKEADIKLKCWKNYSREALINLLRQNMNTVANVVDLHEKASCLKEVLNKCVGKLVVVKFIKSKNVCKWYSVQLLEMKRRRDISYKKYLRREEDITWEEYKIHRNEYACALRRAKRQYVQRKIEESKHNSKELWKVLKGLMRTRSVPRKCIKFNGVEVDDNETIANEFNNYFIDSVDEISASISFADEPPELKENYTESQLSCFTRISLEKLRTIVWSLDTKSGSDDINAQILKDGFEVIGETLLELINTSLEKGEMPHSWKESLVVPIEKVAGTDKAEEYRPINMLPIYEKTLELTVKEQLLDYISENNILVPEQSGYRKNHSCETALNLLLAKWKECLEKKLKVVAVFLDLKRAFETISREKLVSTLAKYRISGTALKWFSTYLSHRYQRTKFNSVISGAKETQYGVPQGSVLGPILFILYINDLKRILKNCDINLFADDTVIFIASNNATAATEKLNSDLVNLSKWLKYKKLKLNVTKTKCLVVSSKSCDSQCVHVKIDGETVECVKSIKYLGVVIDDKLTFRDHIDHTVKKIARKYGVLCRLAKDLTQWSLIHLYKTLISPHFDFCPSIIYLANEQQMYRLQKLQNKIMRIILRCNRRTSVRLMLDTLQWLSVRQRVTFLTLLLIHRIANGTAPEYLSSRIVRGRDIHQHRTRFAEEIRCASFLLASSQNSLYYKGIKLYNTLPRDTKNETNLNAFKRKCLCFVKSNVDI